jgi:hypothetical protein
MINDGWRRGIMPTTRDPTVPRSVKPVSREVLSTLSGGRLLAYRERLLSLEESPASSDSGEAELAGLEPSLIWFKADPRWRVLYEQVVGMLRDRHAEQGGLT